MLEMWAVIDNMVDGGRCNCIYEVFEIYLLDMIVHVLVSWTKWR